MSRSSLALSNLRGFAIVMVVAFHSLIAYLGSQPASPIPFDDPPYAWRANPIVDSARWFGFDLFCALQYIYLMQLLFFLSGLFVWPSLSRKGARTFLYDRLIRLGVPFAVGLYVLMPIAYYPVYRVTAVDTSWSAFWSHWIALPFWPSGPMWFLWVLLLFNIVAAALFWLAPRAGEFLGRLWDKAGLHPGRFFLALVSICAVAYRRSPPCSRHGSGCSSAHSRCNRAWSRNTPSISSPVSGSARSVWSEGCSRRTDCWPSV